MSEQFEKWFEEELDSFSRSNALRFGLKKTMYQCWQSSREALWQTMDSAPLDGSYFLIYDGDRIIEGFWKEETKYDDEGFYASDKYPSEIFNATHWMIPVLPKQDVFKIESFLDSDAEMTSLSGVPASSAEITNPYG
jgi:hypothetical protein